GTVAWSCAKIGGCCWDTWLDRRSGACLWRTVHGRHVRGPLIIAILRLLSRVAILTLGLR
nr:hypothetical protein [Tanacetum cinerariifolium]